MIILKNRWILHLRNNLSYYQHTYQIQICFDQSIEFNILHITHFYKCMLVIYLPNASTCTSLVQSISSYINKFDVLENRIKFHVVGKQTMKVLIQPLMVLLMLYICFTDSFESSIEHTSDVCILMFVQTSELYTC